CVLMFVDTMIVAMWETVVPCWPRYPKLVCYYAGLAVCISTSAVQPHRTVSRPSVVHLSGSAFRSCHNPPQGGNAPWSVGTFSPYRLAAAACHRPPQPEENSRRCSPTPRTCTS